MKAIRLSRSQHVWTADFVNDETMRADIGTTEIPLPFTRNASPSVVLAHVVKRNPGAEVFIDFIGENANGQPSPVQMFIDTVSETAEWMQSARGAA